MINSNCNNCNNCNAVTRLPGLQPSLPSPRPILSWLPPCAALRLLPGRSAVPKLPSAMGNGEPSLNCVLPSLNITDEEALEVVVNETDKLARICKLYRYKIAS